MNNQSVGDESESEPEPNEQEKGFFRRLISLLDFRRPGTKEDLDHEIQELLEEGEEHGLISALEEKMINSILEFRETNASEVMTPAAEVVSFDRASPMSVLVEIVIQSGFTRIPVYDGNPDKVIGLIHAKDLLELCASPRKERVDIVDYLRPIYFIPESKPIVDLLREFQKRKVHMAMVTDEFGAMRGLITMEDILEEIVGEIDDEYDEEERSLEVIDGDTISVHGWVDIEKIEEHFDVEFPDGPYESAGGLVIHLLGRIAQLGDSVEIGDFTFTVKSASARRIRKILVHRMSVDKG
ncbi:hemolysin family protein [Desulforhopalus singaporensis]|uniref:CBS domain-containing protein n=1 Tax=Desulforhopalus singaporensis TaxID=91360 RepID=A0A1H0SY95_9BACT|nr:hemolysin family protein [Desulforhopalus singaporensis]SDP46530.1 CBS domain-containing protein [Desulforhopalus singaporensis]